ncbi:hypothetical protein [uncultured Draconibacterium sp.]|uniref:hypothetical protein n=1 Tax=uncultured Draconibacterium sp. TaxID=1573823 RepID=UPI0029C753AC|nr:hypothetical protein [uncultured Draconibacterium sp.]
MTKNFFIILFALLILSFKNGITNDSLVSVDGLTLYMQHDVFGEGGRRLSLEFSETKQFKTSYSLVFQYKITNDTITIRLLDKVDTEKNKKIKVTYGMPGSSLKTPRGRLALPDNLLSGKDYYFMIETANFKVESKLTIDNDKIVLDIPENKYFSCKKNIVYPIPKNLVFGSVIFYGDKDNECGVKFFKEFEAIGMTNVQVPNYPYNHLSVNDNGKPENQYSPNGQNNIRFLYKMDTSFRKAARLTKKWYRKKLNIDYHIYSSNGDQALLDKFNGIVTTYADKK